MDIDNALMIVRTGSQLYKMILPFPLAGRGAHVMSSARKAVWDWFW